MCAVSRAERREEDCNLVKYISIILETIEIRKW